MIILKDSKFRPLHFLLFERLDDKRFAISAVLSKKEPLEQFQVPGVHQSREVFFCIKSIKACINSEGIKEIRHHKISKSA